MAGAAVPLPGGDRRPVRVHKVHGGEHIARGGWQRRRRRPPLCPSNWQHVHTHTHHRQGAEDLPALQADQ